MKTALFAAIPLLSIVLTVPAAGTEPEVPLLRTIKDCRLMADSLERLKCYDGATDQIIEEEELSPEEAIARDVVRSSLRDPESAKWGQFQGRGSQACIEVNARTSAGGYSGMQIFFVGKESNGEWFLENVSRGSSGLSRSTQWDICINVLSK